MSRTRLSRRHVLTLLSTTGVLGRAGRVAQAGQQEHTSTVAGLKTIGILGGLGPQATIDFEARLHRAAQRLIPQRQNSGYPPVVVYYHRRPPFVLNEDLHPRLPIEPDPQLLDAARRLGSWVDFLVIPSNGPHLIQEQLERAAGKKILSMVDVTLNEVGRRRWRKVGVLGFGDPVVYTEPLRKLQVQCETVGSELRDELDPQIIRVMEGRNDARSSAIAGQAIAALRARNVDGVILGCTEIPLLLDEKIAGSDLINPAELLAEAAVKYASQ